MQIAACVDEIIASMATQSNVLHTGGFPDSWLLSNGLHTCDSLWWWSKPKQIQHKNQRAPKQTHFTLQCNFVWVHFVLEQDTFSVRKKEGISIYIYITEHWIADRHQCLFSQKQILRVNFILCFLVCSVNGEKTSCLESHSLSEMLQRTCLWT